MSTTTSLPAAEFDPEVPPTPPSASGPAPDPPRARRVIIGAPSPAEPTDPVAEPAPGSPSVRRVIIGAPLPVPEVPVPAAPVAVEAIPGRRDLGHLARRIGAWRGIALGALAVIIAAVGEALLFQEPSRNAGALLIVLGMVLGAGAWHSMPEAPLLTLRAAGLRDLVRWRRGLILRLAGIGGALALAGGSILAWGADPNAIFGWQGVLWLASMGLLLLACAR